MGFFSIKPLMSLEGDEYKPTVEKELGKDLLRRNKFFGGCAQNEMLTIQWVSMYFTELCDHRYNLF